MGTYPCSADRRIAVATVESVREAYDDSSRSLRTWLSPCGAPATLFLAKLRCFGAHRLEPKDPAKQYCGPPQLLPMGKPSTTIKYPQSARLHGACPRD